MSFLRTIFAPKHMAPSIDEFAILKREFDTIKARVEAHSDAQKERKKASGMAGLMDSWWIEMIVGRPERTHKEIDKTLDLILDHLGLEEKHISQQPAKVELAAKPKKRGKK